MIQLTRRKYYLLISILALFITVASCKKSSQVEQNRPPIANAGKDTTISFPSSTVILNGSASSDPDGNIAGFLWTKISGPSSCKLGTSNAAQSTADSLKEGVYQFELKVTDAEGLFDMDTVKITVNEQLNKPPVANAGADQINTLPANSVNLDGSASSDPDNNIVSYLWTKIWGPFSFNIGNVSAVKTQVTNLVEGFYLFELKVIDADGLFSKDTIQVEVRPQSNQQNLANVCFYFPEPTGTISYSTISFPGSNLFTVTINNVSDTLNGVWGLNYSPHCPIKADYSVEAGENCLIFDLPPGTYNWTAKSLICNLYSYPEVSGSFIQYFLTPHSTSGTITANPGNSCIIQKIVFP